MVVGLEAAVQMAFGVCDEHGEPPGGHPRSRPMGKGHRAERPHRAGSPETDFKSLNNNFLKLSDTHKS